MLLIDHLLYRTQVYGRDVDYKKKDVFRIGPVTNMSAPKILIPDAWNNGSLRIITQKPA